LGAAAARLRTPATASPAWIRPMKAVTLLAAILLAQALHYPNPRDQTR
jgi:hypothetical protein